MQKKQIQAGMEVAVYVDGLQEPQEIETYGGKFRMKHGFTVRGVAIEHRHDSDIVQATVKALDQKRPTRGRYRYSFSNDGVLVEFSKPHKIKQWGKDVTVKTAVLDTKHILEPWAETKARREAQETARIESDKKAIADAEAFEPEIGAAFTLFAQAGLSPVVGEDALHFEGGSVRFEVTRMSDRTPKVTGWSWRKVEIDREVLFALLRQS